MSELKVNSIKGVSASTAAISIDNSSGTCTANLTNRTNKNLIINGAMQVAQRGTSYTGGGYETVDRFFVDYAGLDEVPTQAQVDVASGTSPYASGFRKAWKITNGNQTSGAGAADVFYIKQNIEAQNIAQSGWNYTSSSSNITLSFWIKSSVAQTFKGHVRTQDGTAQIYHFETGSLTADTWTKITKTISGNSNLQFDTNNEAGLGVVIIPFAGTNFTDSSVNENAWQAYDSTIFGGKDNTTTWYTTNDATREVTGFQLEVSDHVTDFEHRSFAQELTLCHRYYYRLQPAISAYFGAGFSYNSNTFICHIDFPVIMRANVTALEQTGTAAHYKVIRNGTTSTCSSVPTFLGDPNNTSQSVAFNFNGSLTQGEGGLGRSGNASAFLGFSAEL